MASSRGFDPKKDYYNILGLGNNAHCSQLKTVFFRLARMYHPDKTGGDLETAEKFKEVREAYEVLTDPDLKDQYDRARFLFDFEKKSEGFTPPPPSPSESTKDPASGCKERQRNPYSSSYTQSDHRSGNNTRNHEPPPPPRNPSPVPRAAPRPRPRSSNTSSTRARDCHFSDYYFSNYTEKPDMLPRLRAEYEGAYRAWKLADEETKNAKHLMEYYAPKFSEPTELRMDFEEKRKISEGLKAKKWRAEAVFGDHQTRAKTLLRRRKHDDARVRGADAARARTGRRKQRGW